MNKNKPNRLVIFDVEGVLLPRRRYMLIAARKLGFLGFIKVVVIGIFYEIGLLSIELTLRRVFKFFRRIMFDDLFRLYKDIPLTLGAEEVFKRLRSAGCRTALISSGLPQLVVKDLAVRLNADYAFGLELETRNGTLTGKVYGDALKPEGKALILKKILKEEGLPQQSCIVIADDRNNLSMFPLCALRIGFNPDFIVSAKSDCVVKGNLFDIMPLIVENNSRANHPILSRNEIIRQMIHLSGFFVPLVLGFHLTPFLNRYQFSLLLLITTTIYTVSEIARKQEINIPIITTITQKAATKPELHQLATDPIFFALGIALTLILYPEPICYAAITISVLGDGFAMLFGKTIGKTPFPHNKNKKIEGTILGFLPAFIGSLLFVNPKKALIGATVGMLIESLPVPISDNLTMPIATGLALITP